MSTKKLLLVSLIAGVALSAQAQPRISDDRDLKDIDLTGWDCLNRLEGSAKTPDGQERNRGKNRSAVDLAGLNVANLDWAGFRKLTEPFDLATKGRRRKDVGGAAKTQLESMEKQVVSVTGYLVLAYAGPPETTNCASVDFHDWHLEVFEKPADHPPHVGDPTPIICEVTPRTQKAIYAAGIRLLDIAGFMRRPDLTYEPTGHPAKKIRLTGYLLWDDDHNGSADIGPNIQSIGSNGYHNPWRATAWEMHPVFKIEVVDGSANAVPSNANTPPSSPSPSVAATTGAPAPEAAPQTVVIVEPVKIKIPYGETVLPRGLQLKLLSRDAQSVTVRYMETAVRLPLQSVEIR